MLLSIQVTFQRSHVQEPSSEARCRFTADIFKLCHFSLCLTKPDLVYSIHFLSTMMLFKLQLLSNSTDLFYHSVTYEHNFLTSKLHKIHPEVRTIKT